MQNTFPDQVVKSEFVPSPFSQLHDMPSYNPEVLIEERLRESIRQSVSKEINLIQSEDQVKQMKNHSYKNIQAWMDQIGQDLVQHKQIVKDVYRTLERRMQLSDRSILNLIDFLRKFVDHEKENAGYLKNKNVALINLFTDGKYQMYPRITQTIHEIDNYDQGNAQKILDLLDGIEKFIKAKLEINIQMFDQGMKQLKDIYSKSFGQYAESAGQLNKYRKKYQKLYNQMMTTNQVPQKKDLYHVERKLVNTFVENGRHQQSLGIAVQRIWEELKKQEYYRYDVVISSLRMYLDKHVLLTQSKQQKLSAQEEMIYAYLNELSPEIDIGKSIDIIQTIPMSSIKQLQRMLATQDITDDKLKYFLTKYPEIYLKVAEQEQHTLVKYKVKNAQVDCGALLKTWKECNLIVTIDNNLIIYSSDKFHSKYHLPNCTLMQKTRSPLTAELKETRKGILFDSHTSVILQLNEEEFDQLHDIFKQQSDPNQIIKYLYEIAKSSNQYNKITNKITLSKEYVKQLESVINQSDQISLINITKGLDAFRYIIRHRELNLAESMLVNSLKDKATQIYNQPFAILCDTYLSLSCLRLDTKEIVKVILDQISNQQIVEGDFTTLVRGLSKYELNEYEQSLFKILSQYDITQYTKPGQFKIFRYFAEIYSQYKKPFYDYSPQMNSLSFTTKFLQPICIPDILSAYWYTGQNFSDILLVLALKEFNKFVLELQGCFNEDQFTLFSIILKECQKLNIQSIDWNFYLKIYLDQLENNTENQVSLNSQYLFFTIFMNMVNNENGYMFINFIEIIKKYPKLIKSPLFWEFVYLNKIYFPENTLQEFNNLYKYIQYSHSDSLLYGYFGQQLKIQDLTIQSNTPSFYPALRAFGQSFQNYDELTHQFLLKQKGNLKFITQNLSIVLNSICGEQTLGFWRRQINIFYKKDLPQLLQIYQNRTNFEFPKRYNQYQLQYLLELLRNYHISPIIIAPQFHKNLSKYPLLVEQYCKQLNALNLLDLIIIWEQMEYNELIVKVIHTKFHQIKQLELNPLMHRFMKMFSKYQTDEECKIIFQLLNQPIRK